MVSVNTSVTLMSSITPERSEWLWHGYIPLGELTIIEGHPGVNKSLFACDIAARLTRGDRRHSSPQRTVGPRQGGRRLTKDEGTAGRHDGF